MQRFHGFAGAMLACVCAASAAWSIDIDSVTVAEPAPPAAVPKYAKLELLVALSNVAATKPYDPDPAQGGLDLSATFTAPGGAQTTVNGFFDGTSWRVRFAPTAEGDWTYAVQASDAGGSASLGGGGFTCAASASPGFARIAGRFLSFSGGERFFPVGHNNGWQYDLEQPTFPEMASGGENLLSFWMNSPWVSPADAQDGHRAPIENATDGLGNYSQGPCAYLDGLLQRAEAAGVYLLPCIWTHGQLREDFTHAWGDGYWENNPYSTVCSSADFFKRSSAGADTPQWRCQKNYYRYILARWGYSRAVIGWVLVVEIDGSTPWSAENSSLGASHPSAAAWCTAVHDYFAAQDAYRRNALGQYPIVTSRTDFYSNYATWANGENLRSVDSYSNQTNNVQIGKVLADQTRSMNAADATPRPAFHSEFGGDVPHGAIEPLHLHNGLWGGTAAGAALAPLKWCDGGGWPMLTDATVGEDLRAQYARLSEFLGGLDYVADPALTAAAISINDSFSRAYGMRLSDRGFAWLQRTSGTPGGQTLTLSALVPGTYSVSWFDPWVSGLAPVVVQSGVLVQSNGVLSTTVPATTQSDWVLSFQRTGDLPPPPPQLPAAPTNLAASVSGSTVTLTWSDNATNETGYRIDRGVKNKKTVLWTVDYAAAGGNATSFSESVAAGTYYYRVRATNGGGSSAYSNQVQVQVGSTRGGGKGGKGSGGSSGGKLTRAP